MNPIRTNKSLIARLCLLCAWFTSSGDVVFNIDIGGSLRYTQILAIFFSVFSLVSCGIRVPSRGFVWMAIFAVVNAIFILNNEYPLRAAFYALWLFQNVVFVWAFISWVDSEDDLRWAVRGSIWAAVGVACFGLAMFALDRLGFYFEIVTQPGRINGFSYEPSYFATFLIPLWIVLVYCIERKAVIWSSAGDVLMFLILTVALLLSTSRTATVAIGFWFVRLFLVSIYDALRGRVPTRSQVFFVAGLGVAGIMACVLFFGLGLTIYDYVGGTGLFDTAAHSVNERTNGMEMTWEVFKSSPYLGCSLGGVAVQIGALMGLAVTSIAEAKSSEGVSVFLEILAGTGIFGFLVLMRSFYVFCKDSWTYKGHPDVLVMARGLVWGFIVLISVLQLTQNILRPYVWYYIALLGAAGAVGVRNLARMRSGSGKPGPRLK